MFQNKNNISSSDTTAQAKSAKAAIKLEDFPIHTMKKDLEEAGNPGLKQESAAESPKKEIPLGKEAMQKSSPFFTAQAEKKPVNLPVETPQKSAPAIPETKQIRSDNLNAFITGTKKPETNSFQPVNIKQTPIEKEKGGMGLGRIIMLVCIILLVIILAGGGYYFWATQQSATISEITPPASETPKQEPIPEPEPEPEPQPIVPEFSVDKPNYLNIDIANSDTIKIKESLQDYAAKVVVSGVTAPIEFSVVDMQNNPVSFQSFSAKTGIIFSPALARSLEKDFNLFIYNDKGNARIGLSISTQEPAKLKILMAQEETSLAKELENIFLAADYTVEDKKFGAGNYNGMATKYLNITSPEELSVDYAISDKKLLIGTTMLTLRSIIDYETNPSASYTDNIPAINTENNGLVKE